MFLVSVCVWRKQLKLLDLVLSRPRSPLSPPFLSFLFIHYIPTTNVWEENVILPSRHSHEAFSMWPLRWPIIASMIVVLKSSNCLIDVIMCKQFGGIARISFLTTYTFCTLALNARMLWWPMSTLCKSHPPTNHFSCEIPRIHSSKFAPLPLWSAPSLCVLSLT